MNKISMHFVAKLMLKINYAMLVKCCFSTTSEDALSTEMHIV